MAAETIKELFEKYSKAVYAKKFDEVLGYYDDDAVLIEKGKSCHYGPKAIIEAIKAYHEKLGKTTTENFNEKFDNNGGYYIYDCNYRTQTTNEVLVGSYNQIWKKMGDDFKIIRDEFTIDSQKAL
ncbi:unnamed protein product [Caenorhabditis auriculariae]|uniref:DUF4440 domain-containing protein n=1 Tax=Caenorhabditis auriculariae TaxID=2777116 RepID=A0A8S1H7M2_9PELO|nr:unnamed protein product [Caenorhabditis auriculariae]